MYALASPTRTRPKRRYQRQAIEPDIRYKSSEVQVAGLPLLLAENGAVDQSGSDWGAGGKQPPRFLFELSCD